MWQILRVLLYVPRKDLDQPVHLWSLVGLHFETQWIASESTFLWADSSCCEDSDQTTWMLKEQIDQVLLLLPIHE